MEVRRDVSQHGELEPRVLVRDEVRRPFVAAIDLGAEEKWVHDVECMVPDHDHAAARREEVADPIRVAHYHEDAIECSMPRRSA